MLPSYAQNFEDIILWRALKDISNGFYIDIGAQDPVFDSVSMLFYENGWRGVHVEPSPTYARALREARPDEVVIEAAISNKENNLKFFEFEGTGLSTLDPQIAERYAGEGIPAREMRVESMSLEALLESYADREIHWLKIDVEGHEKSVIESWGRNPVRPWIVVIESTVPGTNLLSSSSWEPLVLGRGYVFAYFDGLNRFYVSEAHRTLLSVFGPGPNVFDGFVRNEVKILTESNDEIRKEFANLEREYLNFRARVFEENTEAARQADISSAKSAETVQEYLNFRERAFDENTKNAQQIASSAAKFTELENRYIELKNVSDQRMWLDRHHISRADKVIASLKSNLAAVESAKSVMAGEFASALNGIHADLARERENAARAQQSYLVSLAREQENAVRAQESYLASHHETKARFSRLAQEFDSNLKIKAEDFEAQVTKLAGELNIVKSQMQLVLSSTSWKASAPIRTGGRAIRSLLRILRYKVGAKRSTVANVISSASATAEDFEARAIRLTHELDFVNNQLQLVRSSTSWKMSTPIRIGRRAIRSVLRILRYRVGSKRATVAHPIGVISQSPAPIAADNFEARAARLAYELDTANNQLQLMLSSTSWRASAPIRVGGRVIRRVLRILRFKVGVKQANISHSANVIFIPPASPLPPQIERSVVAISSQELEPIVETFDETSVLVIDSQTIASEHENSNSDDPVLEDTTYEEHSLVLVDTLPNPEQDLKVDINNRPPIDVIVNQVLASRRQNMGLGRLQ